MAALKTKVQIFKLFQKEDKKPLKVVGKDRSVYVSWNIEDMLQSAKKGDIVEMTVEQLPDYNGQKQFKIQKVIALITNSDNAGEVLPEIDTEGGIDSPSITQAPLPLPLTVEQVNIFYNEAVSEARERYPKLADEKLIQTVSDLFNAKLQSQQQDFSLQMSKFVQSNKLKNMGALK